MANNVFRRLRPSDRVFSTAANATSNASSLRGTFPAFDNVFNHPSSTSLGGGRYRPSFNSPGNPSVNRINRAMRTNNAGDMRSIFNATDANIDSVGALRRSQNVPDARISAVQTRQSALRDSHPSLNTRSRDGVERALNNNPRFRDYLVGAGVITMTGVGVVLVLRGVDLINEIIEALNRTGGSHFHRGLDGGDRLESCVLRFRTCGIDPSEIPSEEVCQNFLDPLIDDEVELRAICSGYNLEREGTVCRASDAAADVDSPQYVDLSDLAVDQTITCIEPYSLGDLIGDLGLDWLLGEDSALGKSSNKSSSASENLFNIILILGVIIVAGVLIYFIFRATQNRGGGGGGGGSAGGGGGSVGM